MTLKTLYMITIYPLIYIYAYVYIKCIINIRLYIISVVLFFISLRVNILHSDLWIPCSCSRPKFLSCFWCFRVIRSSATFAISFLVLDPHRNLSVFLPCYRWSVNEQASFNSLYFVIPPFALRLQDICWGTESQENVSDQSEQSFCLSVCYYPSNFTSHNFQEIILEKFRLD